jgi:hypothetical protein
VKSLAHFLSNGIMVHVGVKWGQVQSGERLCERLTERKCKRFRDLFSERLWFEFGE